MPHIVKRIRGVDKGRADEIKKTIIFNARNIPKYVFKPFIRPQKRYTGISGK